MDSAKISAYCRQIFCCRQMFGSFSSLPPTGAFVARRVMCTKTPSGFQGEKTSKTNCRKTKLTIFFGINRTRPARVRAGVGHMSELLCEELRDTRVARTVILFLCCAACSRHAIDNTALTRFNIRVCWAPTRLMKTKSVSWLLLRHPSKTTRYP